MSARDTIKEAKNARFFIRYICYKSNICSQNPIDIAKQETHKKLKINNMIAVNRNYNNMHVIVYEAHKNEMWKSISIEHNIYVYNMRSSPLLLPSFYSLCFLRWTRDWKSGKVREKIIRKGKINFSLHRK